MSSRLVYPPEETSVPKLRNTTYSTVICRYCKSLDKSETIHSSFGDQTWKGRISCHISYLRDNVVYMITCLKCRSQYVGETKRVLRGRMYEHFQYIETFSTCKPTTPVLGHFNKCCMRQAKLTFQILKMIRGDLTFDETTKLRCKKETCWILNLKCWTSWECMQLCRVLAPTYKIILEYLVLVSFITTHNPGHNGFINPYIFEYHGRDK